MASRKNNRMAYLNKTWLVTYAALAGVTLGFLILIRLFNISYPLSVTTTQSSEFSVVGEGKVDVVPDEANLEAGILVANAVSVDGAQKEINDKNNAIIKSLGELGISKKDIKTSNYSVTPNQDYNPGSGGRITGYNGNVTVSVTIKDTSKVPQVVQAVTAAGANQVYSVNYTIQNPEKYREDARNKAIANAKEQAQKLSASLGVRLGRVVNIVESSPNQGPILYTKDAVGGQGNAPDIQPGTETVSSVVTLYFDRR
jgi:uncharacterized protein YggE